VSLELELELGRGGGQKALPMLPSVDDEDEDTEKDETPKGGAVVALPPTSTLQRERLNSWADAGERKGFVRRDQINLDQDTDKTPMPTAAPTISTLTSPPSINPTPLPLSSTTLDTDPPSHRLSALRQTFHRTEQSLYAQLARTPGVRLNDARRAFLYAAMGARRRLEAWQRKYVPGGPVSGSKGGFGAGAGVEELGAEEPEWWGRKYHALPGGNVIVREDDWGSVIAFTLR